MERIVLNLVVHQPYRIRKFRTFDIGKEGIDYFDDDFNRDYFNRVANEVYLEINNHLLGLLDENKVKLNISLSGLALEQFVRYAPKLLESFDLLFSNPNVDVYSVPYYYSNKNLISEIEQEKQIERNNSVIKKYFGVDPIGLIDNYMIYDRELLLLFEKLKENQDFSIFDNFENFRNFDSKETFLENLNELQRDAVEKLFLIENNLKFYGDEFHLEDWRKLTSQDFIDYMETDNYSLNEPSDKRIYGSPYDSYLYFMNIVNDLTYKINLLKVSHEKEKMLDRENYNFEDNDYDSLKKEIL